MADYLDRPLTKTDVSHIESFFQSKGLAYSRRLDSLPRTEAIRILSTLAGQARRRNDALAADTNRFKQSLLYKWRRTPVVVAKNCKVCGGLVASDIESCIHCGAACPVRKTDFAFRENVLGLYQYLVPKGQYENVMEQLRDDYKMRFQDYGCNDHARRKANLWLTIETARDIGPAVVKLFAWWLGSGIGVSAAIRWVLKRDE